MIAGGGATVEVEVEVTDDESAVEPAPTTVVVTPDAGVPAELLPILTTLSERLGAVEQALSATAAVAVTAADSADAAQSTADAALDVAISTSEETEEALATVAEAADAVTPEVMAEVEDVAPHREHPWFAGRKVMTRD